MRRSNESYQDEQLKQQEDPAQKSLVGAKFPKNCFYPRKPPPNKEPYANGAATEAFYLWRLRLWNKVEVRRYAVWDV
eukprot:3661131-Amphidinium_carterae.1